MKKLAFLLFISIFVFSCDEGGSVSFYVNDSSTSTIESSLPINLPFNLPILAVTSTNTKEFENNKTAPNLIKAVVLETITVTVTSPDNEDFSFLDAIEISILTPDQDDNDDGEVIAYLENINSSDRVITLTTTDVNLIPYLKLDSYKLKTEATVKEVLLHDVDIKIDLKFKITADLL